jgi:Tfp pilus assembly PilM family ATPase
MSRETKFKVRLVEAARAAGLNPRAVEVDVNGCIRVISGKREDAGGDLDKWLEEHPS